MDVVMVHLLHLRNHWMDFNEILHWLSVKNSWTNVHISQLCHLLYVEPKLNFTWIFSKTVHP